MPAIRSQQCPTRAGSGVVSCSACNGSGGRSETRIEYDWENNPVYREGMDQLLLLFRGDGGMQPMRRPGQRRGVDASVAPALQQRGTIGTDLRTHIRPLTRRAGGATMLRSPSGSA